LDDHLTDSSLASILFASAGFGAGCSAGVYLQLVMIKRKFFIISIHKPPALIKFLPMKHAFAVTIEPFQFSPAKPVAYDRWLMNGVNIEIAKFQLDSGYGQGNVKVDNNPLRLWQFTTTILDLKFQIPIPKFEISMTKTFW